MSDKSFYESEVKYILKRIDQYKSEITSPSEEFYLGSLNSIASNYFYLTYAYVAIGKFDKALESLENAIKYSEYTYQFFKYWQKEILPYVVEREKVNLISRLFNKKHQAIELDVKEIFKGFGINADDRSIRNFLKEEKHNFEKVQLSILNDMRRVGQILLSLV